MSSASSKSLAQALQEANKATHTSSEKYLKAALDLAERENAFLNAHADEIEGCTKGGVVSALEGVLATIKVLKVCSKSMQKSDEFLDMIYNIRELDDNVRMLPGPQSELGAGYVCTLLRTESSKLRDAFKVRCENLIRQSVQIDSHCVRVLKGLGGLNDDDDDADDSPRAHDRVSQELSMTGIWKGIATNFADEPDFCTSCIDLIMGSIWEVVISPLLATRGALLTSSEQESSLGAMFSIGEKEGSSVSSEGAVVGAKIEVLHSLLLFMREHIFPPNGTTGLIPAEEALLEYDSMREVAFYGLLQRKLMPRLQQELAQAVALHMLAGRYDLANDKDAVSLRARCEDFDSMVRRVHNGSSDDNKLLYLCDVWTRLPRAVVQCTEQIALDCLRTTRLTGSAASSETVQCSGFDIEAVHGYLSSVNKLTVFAPFSVSMESRRGREEVPPGCSVEGGWQVTVSAANCSLLFLAVARSLLSVLSNLPQQSHFRQEEEERSGAGIESVLETFVALFASLSKTASSGVLSPRQAAILSNDLHFLSKTCLLCATQVRQQMNDSDYGNDDDEERNGMMMIVSLQAAKCALWLRGEAQSVLGAQQADQAFTVRRLMRRMRLSVDDETAPMEVELPSSPAGVNITGAGNPDNINKPGPSNNYPDEHDHVPTRPGISGGVYGLAQSLGALETPSRAPPGHIDMHTPTPSTGVGAGAGEVGSVSGLGIRRGIVGLLHAFDTPSHHDQDRLHNSSGPLNDATAAEAVGRHLLLLIKQWKGILSPTSLASVMGALLEDVVQMVLGAVLSSPCISEASIDGLVGVLMALQEPEESLAKECFFGASRSAEATVAQYAPSWPKLAALVRFLVCPSLSAVAEALSNRQFASFSSAEVSTLVCSVFEDSHKRAHVLSNIHELVSK